MKYITKILPVFLLLGFLVLTTAPSIAQSKDVIEKHFSELVKDKKFTSVTVNPKIINKLSNDPEKEMDEDVKALITQLHGLHILSTEGNSSLRHFENAKNTMSSTNYEELLSVQESEQDKISFYIDEKSNAIKELIMIQGKANNFSITTFLGDDIDLKSLIKLSQSLDVDGMDQLKKLNDK